MTLYHALQKKTFNNCALPFWREEGRGNFTSSHPSRNIEKNTICHTFFVKATEICNSKPKLLRTASITNRTKDLLLRDKFFQFSTEYNFAAELAHCSVVGEKKVGMITIQDNAVAFRYGVCMIWLCNLHTNRKQATLHVTNNIQ